MAGREARHVIVCFVVQLYADAVTFFLATGAFAALAAFSAAFRCSEV